MTGYRRRLDRLAGWEAERRWATATLARDRLAWAEADPEYGRVLDTLNALADAMTTPATRPPAWFVVNAYDLDQLRRRDGLSVTLAEYRAEAWRMYQALETPAGRRLWREIQAIEARYTADSTAEDAKHAG